MHSLSSLASIESRPRNGSLVSSPSKNHLRSILSHYGSSLIDPSLRKDPLCLIKIETYGELLAAYHEAIEHMEKTKGIKDWAWRALGISELTPEHQSLVYKLCPHSSKPTLGQLQLKDLTTRHIVFYVTKSRSGYILF